MDEMYLVTGAGGHVGNTVVRRLAEVKKRVRCLLLPMESEEALQGIDCEIVRGDVTKKETLHALFDLPEGTKIFVVHCAGIVSIASDRLRAVYDVNVGGTRNVADICLEKQVEKLVHVSSVHAIPEGTKGEPIAETGSFDPAGVEGAYAKTKAEATQYVLDLTKKGLRASVVHPSGIIGPNDYGMGHMTQLIVDFALGRLTAGVRGGYDFVDVRDVADGIMRVLERGRPGECYILSNRYVTVPQLLKALSGILHKRPVRVFLPMWFAKMTAPFAELYYKILRQKPLYTKYSLYTITSNAHFTNQKARRELGYRPRPIQTTLRDTVRWLKAQRRLTRPAGERAGNGRDRGRI